MCYNSTTIKRVFFKYIYPKACFGIPSKGTTIACSNRIYFNVKIILTNFHNLKIDGAVAKGINQPAEEKAGLIKSEKFSII